MKHPTIILMTLMAWVTLTASAVELKLPPRPENYNPAAHLEARLELEPLLETPLRHTYITRGPGGSYYLTGTVSKDGRGNDFQNNDGVWLWRSPDLKEWEPLGQVWSIERHGSEWQKRRNLNPESPAGPLVRGVTAPEIHFLKATWWIAYSMNDRGTGLLRSTTGKPEGPYEDAGRITATEGSPSLFEDFDGSIYWVWGPGRIAQMKEDMTGLAQRPRQLTFDARFPLTSRMPKLHYPESVSILKTDSGQRRYFLIVESGSCRLGRYTRDTHIFASDSLFGGYRNDGDLKHATRLLEHGAQSTVFRDAESNWYATFYGADGKAIWRDRPAIVSLDYDPGRGRPRRGNPRQFTESGPWATMAPLFADCIVNDQQMLNARDGYYYFTGSMWGDRFRKHGLSIWKSKTLEPRSQRPENWQEFTPVTVADIPILAKLAEEDPSIFDFTPVRWGPAGRNPTLGTWWNAEFHYLKGTYWIIGGPSIGDRELRQTLEEAGCKGVPLWRSTTGKAEGPYEIQTWIQCSSPSFFEDDDGKIYFLEGVSQIALMKDDMSGIDVERTAAIGRERGIKSYGPWNRIETTENLVMDYDIGNCMVKIGGKYVFFTCNCIGGYDYQYFVADNIWGPYSRPRVAMPHGGHSFVFEDKEGNWHSLQWSGLGMVPFLHELHVEVVRDAAGEVDDIVIMPKWEYEYQQKGEEQ